MPATISEQQLREACQTTLRQWPEARAALLFGSRARGDGREDSDWDVAIVLSGDNPERARPATNPEEFPHAAALFDLDPVDCWTLTEGYLNRRATDLGSLPYAVCRDGRLLAGQLRIPDKKKILEEATLNPESWQDRMATVLRQLNLAMTPIGEVLGEPSWSRCLGDCSDLMQISSNAAELLVKAAMERRGVAADHTHDVGKLARDFQRVRSGEEELARRMSALNGKSRQHHMALYGDDRVELEDVTLAVDRMCGVLALWADEINPSHADRMSGMSGELASRADEYLGKWLAAVRADVVAKPDEGSLAQEAASAVVDGRRQIEEALTEFRDQVQRYTPAPPTVPTPTEDPGPDQDIMPDPFRLPTPFDD